MKDDTDKIMLFLKKNKIAFDFELEKVATNNKISKQEAQVLLFLSHNYKTNRGCDIVEFRGFSKAFVSKAVKKLLERGYITFENDAKDRRYQHIIVNASAKNIIAELKQAEERVLQKLWNGISVKEKENFYAVIDKMIKNL